MATVPTPTTFTAGSLLPASAMNNISAALTFLLSPPRAKAFQTVTQSIANSTWTSITMDSESIDSDAIHSTTTNPSRSTVATAGTYLVTATVAFASNATGLRYARISQNGTAVEGRVSQAASGGVGELSITHLLSCAVGDYLEVQGWQSSGGALSTFYNSPDEGSTIAVLRVGS